MEAAVKELEERILRDGQVLGGGILKVDSFVNHQVDPLLMDACGRAAKQKPVLIYRAGNSELDELARMVA